MGRAKEIIIKVIPSKIARPFVEKHHYSEKTVNNSSLHFGAFLDGKLHGVMSYGSPMDKNKVIKLVQPTKWYEMLELNRMAFDDYLPRNSESRCIAISIKLIKKHAPNIKWILSFSNAAQCGDGTIYRASGFKLTQIKKVKDELWELPLKLRHLSKKGSVIHRFTINSKGSHLANWALRTYGTQYVPMARLQAEHGGRLLDGYQLRYVYLIDKTAKLTVPVIPFSKIDEVGARMYKGEALSTEEKKQASEA